MALAGRQTCVGVRFGDRTLSRQDSTVHARSPNVTHARVWQLCAHQTQCTQCFCDFVLKLAGWLALAGSGWLWLAVWLAVAGSGWLWWAGCLAGCDWLAAGFGCGRNCACQKQSEAIRSNPSDRVTSVGGSAMHMKWPDDIGREAGIGRT